MERKRFRLEVQRYRKSDLILATSPDHKGFFVTARSEQELRELLLGALKRLLEAEGSEVLAVRLEPEELDDFVPAAYIANAEYIAHRA